MVRPTVFLAVVLPFLSTGPNLAAADIKFEAQYSVSLIGIPIGRGAFIIEIAENGYSAAGSATVTGLLKLVAPGKGFATARGKIVDGKVLAADYSSSSESGKRSEEINIALVAGIVRNFSVYPPTRHSSERVPVTEEHRMGVVDPMSAAIMPLPGNGEFTGANACKRTISIFDGRNRYDLVFNHERTEQAKEVKGYSGPLAVCRVTYRPIAGHRPDREQVKKMVENKDIYTWLAPIAGTRVLVPVRVSVATTLGALVVQATRFSSKTRLRANASPPVK